MEVAAGGGNHEVWGSEDAVDTLMSAPSGNRAWRLSWLATCLLLASVACARGARAEVDAGIRPPAHPQPSVAFYYGPDPPVSALQGFDWVVVDGNAQLPESVSGVGPGQHGSTWFAYISMGEAALALAAPDAPPQSCIIGQNQAWKARVIDLRQSLCRDWLWNRRIAPLLDRGFTAFFLDTLDSYQLALSAPDQQRAYREGMVAVIERIRARLPQARFILNRGFQLLDALPDSGVVGVAAESLYRGWDQSSQRYVSVPSSDTLWLKHQLGAVKARGLVPIAIDYVPDDDLAAAQQTAERIAADGFVPYVTNGTLNRVGTGTVSPAPREILMLYDGDESPVSTNVNWYAAMVLNHMGYATRTLNVDTTPLPQTPMRGRLAGIVTWFSGDDLKHSDEIHRWLRRQMASGVPVAILGHFGFPMDPSHLAPFDLVPGPDPAGNLAKVTVTTLDTSLIGFEAPLHPSPDDFVPLQLLHGHPALTLQRDGQQETAVAITPWGGYALAPNIVSYLPRGALDKTQGRARWLLNPFVFFQRALRLGALPAFDTTTASGNRLLFTHFDGDGFASASFVPKYFGEPAAKVILEAILRRYRMPTAASVIASEFVDGGLYAPAQLAIYRSIARAMFALPWVEIGSHTYSHPFDWSALEQNPDLSAGLHLESGGTPATRDAYVAIPKLKYGYNLPVPGYRFSPQKEVAGSVKIIEDLLAPPGKKVSLYQWSGDTDPSAAVLALTYQAGLLNINGNNSTISKQYPSLTNVVPLGVWKGAHFQVYAPDANEDQFTDGWAPPYCGYRNVLQTFRLTESPRRLAPINVYYHLYSGARPCALEALQAVLDWATGQATTPVFPSYYSRMALGFEYAGIARAGDAYLLGGYGADQTVRVKQQQGYPDFSRSSNIAGFNDANQSRYISLGPDRARLVLTITPPVEPYLVRANAVVTALQRQPGSLSLTLLGQVPLKLQVANVRGCRIRFDGGRVDADANGNLRLAEPVVDTGRLDVECTH